MTLRAYRNIRSTIPHRIDEVSKIPGPNLAITISQYRVFTSNTLESSPERAAFTHVTIMIDQFHMAIQPVKDLADNFSGAIYATIVHNQDLVIVCKPAQFIVDSKNRLSNETRLVVRRHYYRDSPLDKSFSQA